METSPYLRKRKPLSVTLPMRVKPSVKAEIKRFAERAETTPGGLASDIVSAWSRGNSFCRLCKLEHPEGLCRLEAKR